jgi:hypothetical protein
MHTSLKPGFRKVSRPALRVLLIENNPVEAGTTGSTSS